MYLKAYFCELSLPLLFLVSVVVAHTKMFNFFQKTISNFAKALFPRRLTPHDIPIIINYKKNLKKRLSVFSSLRVLSATHNSYEKIVSSTIIINNQQLVQFLFNSLSIFLNFFVDTKI